MDKQQYSDQDIRQYLLGALPEAETLLFDELSFTDENFAGALSAGEYELVDAYVRGELRGADLDRFTSFYPASPLRREKIAFAENLYKLAVAPASAEAPAVADPAPEEKSGFFSRFNIFGGFSPALALAAVLLGIICLSAFWLLRRTGRADEVAVLPVNSEQKTAGLPSPGAETPSVAGSAVPAAPAVSTVPSILPAASPEKTPERTPEKIPSPLPPRPEKTPVPQPRPRAPLPVFASFMLAPSLRGGGQVEDLPISKNVTAVKMRLALESDDYPVYRVGLADESGSVVLWRSGPVRSIGKGENKSLNVHFPAGLLKSKNYVLVVSGVAPGGRIEVVGNYPFRRVNK